MIGKLKAMIKKFIFRSVKEELEQLAGRMDGLCKQLDCKEHAVQELLTRQKDMLLQQEIYQKRICKLENRIIQKEKTAENYQMILDMLVLNFFIKDKKIHFSSIDFLLQRCNSPIGVFDKIAVEMTHKGLKILFHNKLKFFNYDADLPVFDLAYIWGLKPWYEQSKIIVKAQNANVPILMLEDGFIRSIVTWNNQSVEERYRLGHSFTVDDRITYISANEASRLENMLNSELTLTSEQYQRAKMLIRKITANHLSKYNHQPVFTPQVGRTGRKKVLVVDQSYGDMSVSCGWANEETFKEMLQCALKENPEADIIVKTHPDAKANEAVRTGYYQMLEEKENIYKITYDINPISLLQYVDKVYVCTTQMGFEAVMCGKEVHVFGMPFYAGWGITRDRQVCERRCRKRTVEEVFYIAYILYSKYVSFKTNSCCELEQALDEIIELRDEYFQRKGIKDETS